MTNSVFAARRKLTPQGLYRASLCGVFFFGVMLMGRYSQKLIEQTISVFESRSGRVISDEDARQAVENISGFFRVLQEWAEAGDGKSCAESPTGPDMGARAAQ